MYFNFRKHFSLLFQSKRKYYACLRPEEYPKALCQWFQENTGKPLNLENPQTFNEKMQWLKLYDSTQLKTTLSDKLLAKKIVGEKIGMEFIIPSLAEWENEQDIDFDMLPQSFALKSSHASGWNLIVPDKSKINPAHARTRIRKWLKSNYAFEHGFELTCLRK